jgi:hypothetical protein
MLPLVLRTQEEFLVRSASVPLVAGVARYRLPRKAIGGRLREVTVTVGSSVRVLPRVDRGRAEEWPAAATQGIPGAWYLEAGCVVLVPTPSTASVALTMAYYSRPGRLALTTTCGLVSGVETDAPSAGRTRYTYGGVSGGLSGVVDAVAGTPPFEHLAVDLSGTHASTTTFHVASTSVPPEGIAAGDYLCPQDTSCLVQLPVELHPVLVAKCAAAILLQLGFSGEAQAQAANAARLEAGALEVLTPRSDGNPKKAVGGVFAGLRRWQRGW